MYWQLPGQLLTTHARTQHLRYSLGTVRVCTPNSDTICTLAANPGDGRLCHRRTTTGDVPTLEHVEGVLAVSGRGRRCSRADCHAWLRLQWLKRLQWLLRHSRAAKGIERLRLSRRHCRRHHAWVIGIARVRRVPHTRRRGAICHRRSRWHGRVRVRWGDSRHREWHCHASGQ